MNYKDLIVSTIEEKKESILDLSDRIFEFAELGFHEVKSSQLFCKKLSEEGFLVKSGLDGMPTAFRASFGSGKPVIALLAEYDALPGLGQEGGNICRKETPGNSSGHGCGHNLLGAGIFAAALAVKAYLEKHPGKGTVILYGCPSEEKGNAKTIMARDGLFSETDAALTWHPADHNLVTSFSTLANVSVYFDFRGLTSHAAAAPELGRSALDAAELMSVGVNYLREHIIPEARIHYAYIDVGGTAPNVVQGTSRVHYFIRAPRIEQVLEIFERVKAIAAGAALMTGTTNSFELYAGLSDFIPNKTLSGVLYDAMLEIGAPPFDDNDFKTASNFFHLAYPLDTTIAPLNWNAPPMPGSTDVGDVSHVTPTAQLSFATSALGTAQHTWQATAQGNTSFAHKALLTAGSSLALAAVQLMEHTSILDQAKAEWQKRTDGVYLCPIPKELGPHLDD